MSFAEQTKQKMRELQRRPIHKLGQNFLIDEAVLKRIIDAAELTSEDVVEEIGPGTGILTAELVQRAQSVVAIEYDAALAEELSSAVSRPNNLAIIQADALKVGQPEIMHALAGIDQNMPPNKLVANLPYQIAARALLQTFVQNGSLEHATVMVQKEIADRICAHPVSKQYSAYTVKLSLVAEVSDRFEVAGHCFMPQPRVDSTVITLKRKHAPQPHQQPFSEQTALMDATFQLVTAAFAKRRKTLVNALAACGYNKEKIEDALIRRGLSPDIRAEALSTDDFLYLAYELS